MEYFASGMSADKEELKKTLHDLQQRQRELQEQIRNFSDKNSATTAFKPIEHYEDDLKNVTGLIENIMSYIDKGKIT